MDLREFSQLSSAQLEQLGKRLALKGYAEDLKKVSDLAKQEIVAIQKLEKKRAEHNQATKARNINAGIGLSIEEKKLEKYWKDIHSKLVPLWRAVPNPPEKDVPEGGEEHNKPIGHWGEIPEIKKPLDHVQLGERLQIIDIERGAKTSGSRFYFLKNEAVELEFALVQWVLDMLKAKKFELLVPPVMVKEEVIGAGGYLGQAADEVYKVAQDSLYLVGTSEQSILGYHMDENIKVPKRYAAFSTCFRREAGSYGKDVKGIIRTHQFDKIEMFSFVAPEDSKKEHDFLVSLQEKILQDLKIPYQKVLIAAGDLGMPAARKIDLESWLPSQKRYRETHSCSNCTDWQAVRAAIRFRDKDKKLKYVHTLNGTAVAIGRLLTVLLENYQKPDGSVIVPEILQPYLTFREIKPHA
jgi:seryl-tRNA synthetase